MSTISSIYGLRKELGLDDDTARDLYEREVGKRSLKAMSPGEQVRVLQAMRSNVARRASSAVSGPYAKKLQALWISGWNLGLVRNRDDGALIAFVEGQTGISQMRWLRDANDARKAVEALKAWLERAGVDWSNPDPAAAVVEAQGRLLGYDRVTPGDGQPISLPPAEALAFASWWRWRLEGLAAAELVGLQQTLGVLIRKRGHGTAH